MLSLYSLAGYYILIILFGVLIVGVLIFIQTDMEYQEPHSQDRCPGKKRQTIWAQSLYILGGLLSEVGGARA